MNTESMNINASTFGVKLLAAVLILGGIIGIG